MTSLDAGAEDLLRELAPQVLGAVIRRFRDFAASEDAVQEALMAAALQWPEEGIPDNPRGWLIQVAARRMTDHLRADLARRRRETVVVLQSPAHEAPPSLAEFGSSFGAAQPSLAGFGRASARQAPRWSRTTRSSCSSCAVIPR